MRTLHTLFSLAAVLAAVTVAGAQQVDFEAAQLDEWEMPEHIRIVPEGRGHVLSVPMPGHALWTLEPVRDFTLKFRYRHGEGAGDVMFRVFGEPPDHREYHLILATEQVEFIAVSGEEIRQLAQAPVVLAPRTWHDVVLGAHAGSLQVTVDGQPVLKVVDRTPFGAGIFAFGCADGEGVAYDDISLNAGGGVGNVVAGGGTSATPINIPGPQPANTAGVGDTPIGVPGPVMGAGGIAATPINLPGGAGGAGGVAATPINLPGGAQVAMTPISLPGASGSQQNLSIMSDPGTGSGAAASPYRMVLKLPEIQGESTLVSHVKWIDVAAYSYAAKPHDGDGPGKQGSAASLSPLKIIKYVDVASPGLVLAMLKKTSFDRVTLVVGFPTDTEFVKLLTIDLWDASVSEIESGGPNAYGYLTESVELTYKRIRWSYSLRDAISGKPTMNFEATWDVENGKVW